MTRPIVTFTVEPSLPPELERLKELSQNIHWSWNHELLALFMHIDLDLWETSNHNPVRMLGMIKQERLNSLSRDDAFLAQLDRVWERYSEYLHSQSSWFKKNHGNFDQPLIAYYSAEFGLTECIPNYSGGLGILSGDHIKSAADLGIPLIGIGLLYQQGYFRQYLNADGWQQEHYPENDFYVMPIFLEKDKEGRPLTISVDLLGREVKAQIWRVNVGRIQLFLLDTNIPLNQKEDQDITDQLYGGDREMRIKQEILLGIGGYRAIKRLGFNPKVHHLNEGHSAFSVLERTVDLMEEHKLTFSEARELVKAGTVFTTHTPVPAGNDFFAPELIDKYLSSYYAKLGLNQKEFLELGRIETQNDHSHFCMTVLALKIAGRSNGVSKLHGAISRSMWKEVWKGIPEDEIPISSITNGGHGASWISKEMAGLFDRYLGPKWREDPGDYATWSRIHHIPDEELWRTHERRRERLIAFARKRLRSQLEGRGAPPHEIQQSMEILNPNALTVGFARRFATYKRATLLLRDPERLIKILSNKDFPVQFVFAGKAHPQDNEGKELIRKIVHFERHPETRRRMVFLEDYDMVVARYLLQGVDVWLNTPRRPLEASGTSGMKAAFNGALNLSILDGWWAEGYNIHTGWCIGKGEEYEDKEYQDEVEANALYDLLEKELVPLFYNRSSDGLPREWIAKMKKSMRALCPEFNANRMVREYTESFYLPAVERYKSLTDQKLKKGKELAAWKERIHKSWSKLKIVDTKTESRDGIKVGEEVKIFVHVFLGDLSPSDISVELFQGVVDAGGNIVHPTIIKLVPTGNHDSQTYEFSGMLIPATSGRQGFSVRVLPNHEDLDQPTQEGLILWAG